MASKYSTATLMSVIYKLTVISVPQTVHWVPKGMTARRAIGGMKEMIGARVKTHLSAESGEVSSFSISFTPSAIG